MPIRKFGTAEDHQVEVDSKDRQGISKSASQQEWTREDAEDLAKENAE